MLKEFKEFALKGNMVDLAIGVIIGGAFGKLVESIVADLLMPIIGLLTGGIDFSNLYIQLSGAPAPTLTAAREAGATIAYGNFITLLINFLIIAWVLFMVVKAMNRFKKKEVVPTLLRPRKRFSSRRFAISSPSGKTSDQTPAKRRGFSLFLSVSCQQFIICTDGNITNIRVINGSRCDRSAAQ